MKRIHYGIATLLVVGCGGLAASSSNDAGTDHARPPPMDSSPTDRPVVHPHDASPDATPDAIPDAIPDTPAPDDVVSDALECPGEKPASAWSLSPLPAIDGGAANLSLNGVWASGPSDAWVVGSTIDSDHGFILHWNGIAWAFSPIPTVDRGAEPGLNGVWGSGPTDVWAVGGLCSIGFCAPTILHWNGTAWSMSFPSMDSGPASFGFSAVSGSGPTDAWAVGGAISPEGSGGGILHWDGTSWSPSPLPFFEGGVFGFPSVGFLTGVWSRAPNDAWAISGALAAGVLHWDGSAWSFSSSTIGGSGLWGSGPDDVWATGGLQHWNGSKWSAGASPKKDRFYGIWGMGTGDAWTVGNTSLHWDGIAWSPFPLPPVDGGSGYAVYSVAGSGPCDVWAVGSQGVILHHP